MGAQTRLPPDPSTRVGPLRPGDPRRVGGYKLTGLLGEGGMGQVFLGRSPAGRLVAVKLVRPEYARQPSFRERFAREVAAARMVGGSRAVQVLDADPRAERPWMATAYIPAPSLQERVDSAGPLSPARVAETGVHLAEGLAAIHACGLVHRDLKPGNVLLARDGARIIDFGIARAIGAVTLTTAGTMLGTCLYMSPEQLREADVTAASDIFSLGSVLVFAATGAPPFRAATLPGLARDITGGAPHLADVPRPLVPLIAACLAKNPGARPGLDEILRRCAALSRAASRPAPARKPPVRPPEVPHARPRQSPGPVPRRLLLAGGVAAIAAAGTVFPLEFLTSQHPGRRAAAARSRPRAAPPPISRVLVPGPSGAAGTGPGSAVLSPDGSTVAFSTAGPGGARAWLLATSDMQVAASVALGDGPGNGPSAVVFSPGGRFLAALSFGGHPEAARLWRLEAVGLTALNLVTSAAPARPVRGPGSVAFSPDGGTLAVSGQAGLSLLDAVTLRTITSTAAPPGVVGAPLYRPDGKVLAVGGAPGYLAGGSAAGAVCLLDATTLDVIARRSIPDLDAYSLAFAPSSRTLVLVGHTRGSGGVIRVLDATSLRTVAEGVLPGGTSVPATAAGVLLGQGTVTAAATAGLTPDGAILAGYSVGGNAVAWLMQVSTLEIIASVPLGRAGDVTDVAVDLSADGGTLMVAYTSQRTRTGRIQLYRIEPG